jgi:outer membrane protein assembly factor BamD
MIKGKKYLILSCALISLAACKSKLGDDERIIPPQVLYETASMHFENREYKKAAEEFEKIFFQHPGKPITARAELMQAYSLYLAGDYEDSIDVIEIFLKLHPRHENIAYAYYLKAINHHAQISDLDLDQSKSLGALKALEEVINRFPSSAYAQDAQKKIYLVEEHLAGHEMLIGNYYLKKKNPIAAIARFQGVLSEYSSSSYAPEALYRLIETTLMVGLKPEAEKYAQTLSKNYPDTKWNAYSKALLK